MTDSPLDSPLAHTPLYNLHVELGAKLVEFAGYEMPVQYPTGIVQEHLHTRSQAGLFDVSHMGQIRVSGPAAAEALEALMPVDIAGLAVGRQRYALLTNDRGGILDDLMVVRLPDAFLLVVNAACKINDFNWLKDKINPAVNIEMLADRALLALQGPAARQVLSRLGGDAVARMVFMDVANLEIAGVDCLVSCSGYTGEDGYELSVAATEADRLARRLLAEPEVAPVGLGARDSLRLEAGLCLYGHDMNADITPIEAGLQWAISPVRRPGGARAGGYPGEAVIDAQRREGVARRRVLIKPEGRAPVREGAELETASGAVCGYISSGGFGPTVGGPVAMGYVASDTLEAGEPLAARVRGKALPVSVLPQALVAPRYVRKID